MASVFGQSLYAKAGRVAGFQLRPFSPHHALALIEIDSPFLAEDVDDITAWDCSAAVAIMRSRRADGLMPVARLSGSWWRRALWRVWWLGHNEINVAAAVWDYIKAGVRYPEMFIDQEATKPSGAPWPYHLVNTIAREMPCIPYEQLWDMPTTELACHKALLDEASGGAEIAERDLAMMKRAREKKAAEGEQAAEGATNG